MVVTDRRHDQWRTPQQLQVVCNIASAAAKLTAKVGHQERHIENVQLLGKNVFLETAREHHDGVIGDRAADQRMHARRLYTGANGRRRDVQADRRSSSATFSAFAITSSNAASNSSCTQSQSIFSVVARARRPNSPM